MFSVVVSYARHKFQATGHTQHAIVMEGSQFICLFAYFLFICMYMLTPPYDPPEPVFCKQRIMAVGIFTSCEGIARLELPQNL